MAPVIWGLEQSEGVASVVCVAGRHRSTLQQMLDVFNVIPHHDLDVGAADATLNGMVARLFAKLGPVLEAESPDRVLVHGGGTVATVAALAAVHQNIPVAHVEAGLRAANPAQPWLTQMNRRIIDGIGDMLFAPNAAAAENLKNENLGGRIVVTGNTGIDVLSLTVERIRRSRELREDLDEDFPFLGSGRKILLVTAHRRENTGVTLDGICAALAELARRADIAIVYPVHPEPELRGLVRQRLSHLENIHLVAPLDYLRFIRLMQHAQAVLTDSGAIQEEAPALGKPVLLMSEATERPEGVAAGSVRLIGAQPACIVAGVSALFDQPQPAVSRETGIPAYAAYGAYGDGYAAQRIVAALTGKPFAPFQL